MIVKDWSLVTKLLVNHVQTTQIGGHRVTPFRLLKLVCFVQQDECVIKCTDCNTVATMSCAIMFHLMFSANSTLTSHSIMAEKLMDLPYISSEFGYAVSCSQ